MARWNEVRQGGHQCAKLMIVVRRPRSLLSWMSVRVVSRCCEPRADTPFILSDKIMLQWEWLGQLVRFPLGRLQATGPHDGEELRQYTSAQACGIFPRPTLLRFLVLVLFRQ